MKREIWCADDKLLARNQDLPRFTSHTNRNEATIDCTIDTGSQSSGAGRRGKLLPYRMCSTRGHNCRASGPLCVAATHRVDSEFGGQKCQDPSLALRQALGPTPWTLPESQWAWCRPFDGSRLTGSPSAQFRSKEVATLEEW